MANITTENINTLAELASSIGDGDYIYIHKAGANTFARIEKSLFMQGSSQGSGGIDANDIVDALDSSSTDKALSANMGRRLRQLIDDITEVGPGLNVDLDGTTLVIDVIGS